MAKNLVSLIERSTPMLNQLCDKVLAMPRMTEIAKPTIDAFRTRPVILNAHDKRRHTRLQAGDDGRTNRKVARR